MAILKIATLGHPVLREVAKPIPPERILSAEIQQLIADMRETMADYDGVGLAAPQVHRSVRLVILEQSGEEVVLINPIIDYLSNDALRSYEGCLSVPEMRAAVDRCAHVRVTGFDERAQPVDFEAEGFNAIVVQHECDHLDGILYVDRCDTRTLAFLDNYRRHGPLDADFEEE
ncbi:MAG: peptide deformylase [Alphaproteobacteria bacterium]|nr:peptide deformylase [Alphaproteobacteria bacterium]MCB9798059.1 peptide deformylase [Alphaproteobacteria bacterium]